MPRRYRKLYAIGYRFERRVSAHYRKLGYVTIEARGSHGPADIWAINNREILLIQATTNKAYKTEADFNRLRELRRLIGRADVRLIFAYRENRKIIVEEIE